MKRYLLRPIREGYNNQYNTKMDPSVSNEFAAAAFRHVETDFQNSTVKKIFNLFLTSFRFGHVMIPDLFHLFTKSRGLRQPMDGNDVCFAHNLFK